MKRPEILAPAGTPEALKAAIAAGADAVYAGAYMFSARAFAGNFDEKELIEAIDYCHIFGVKIYLAVNTLFKEDELCLIPGFLSPFYKEGLDGVIVQDLGAAALILREFPELPLHASTQMSITSAAGARFLKQFGFKRVIPARELSLSEISDIKKNADVETETFVHGAMCYCYSGKCLLSSFSGGRSGNRGRCAQPCRGLYERNGNASYIMSLKDMCTLGIIPELADAGIDSFKIEGRMKKPEYVAAAAAAYRKAADMYAAGEWDVREIEKMTDDLRDIYNRGGFSEGYYFKQNGQDMISAERPNHTGVSIGQVKKVAPPDIYIKTTKNVNAQDVLDIREAGVELTAAAGAACGGMLTVKGNNFKKIKPGMVVYRTRNNLLLSKIKGMADRELFVEADALVTAKTGEPLGLAITGGGISIQKKGAIVQAAENKPTGAGEIIKKMNKTTGTGLRLRTKCELGENIFIPMSALNELRRSAAEEFLSALAKRGCRK